MEAKAWRSWPRTPQAESSAFGKLRHGKVDAGGGGGRERSLSWWFFDVNQKCLFSLFGICSKGFIMCLFFLDDLMLGFILWLLHTPLLRTRQTFLSFVSRAISLGLDLSMDSLLLPGLPGNDDAEPQQHGCIVCQLTFRTKAVWAVHSYKVHQRVAPERMLLQGRICRVCNGEYHTTVRLFRHLQYSRRCADALHARGQAGVLWPGIGNNKCDRDRPLPLPIMDCSDVTEALDPPEDADAALSPLRTDYCPTLLTHVNKKCCCFVGVSKGFFLCLFFLDDLMSESILWCLGVDVDLLGVSGIQFCCVS